ncbi:large ribosomal subunit protein bL19cz-like isoform X2 [Aristolochia californica]|uniref:large ribosomal subunit protein bL19cz-like isoform X2 n=1 Tax=Aristolochia californica TaxID=171875 RepID=UPI0035E056A4
MKSLKSFHLLQNHLSNFKTMHSNCVKAPAFALRLPFKCISISSVASSENGPTKGFLTSYCTSSSPVIEKSNLRAVLQSIVSGPSFAFRSLATMADSRASTVQDSSSANLGGTPRIKFKRLDKTAKHIMQILDKEAVEKVKAEREIPDIKPGYIIQLKVEVPENKRRVSQMKGIVIARRNAGLNTTFRLRRLVAGVGIESVFPLYSPNIKEIKVLDKRKVRRAKLYYLRDRMTDALKK